MANEPSVRTAIGRHEASTLAGKSLIDDIERITGIAPAIGHSLLEDGFGNMLANSTTGYREWSLQALAALTALGDDGEQSAVYLQAATLHGATEEEILDVLNAALLHSGTQRALNTLRHIESHLAEVRDKRLVGASEMLVELNDHTTMVWESHGRGLRDEGVPMLLIHALNMDHRFWKEVFPVLATKGRVIAYDIRGHGHARGAPPAISLDQLAEDVKVLLDRLDAPKVDVYGASYGGAIAQTVALAMPERVRSLALLATWAEVPHEALASRADDAEQHGMEAQVAKSIIRWFLPETIAEDRWMVRYARNGIWRTRVEEWAAAWRTMATLNVTGKTSGLQMPVLILSGTQDLSSTPAVMREPKRFTRIRSLSQ